MKHLFARTDIKLVAPIAGFVAALLLTLHGSIVSMAGMGRDAAIGREGQILSRLLGDAMFQLADRSAPALAALKPGEVPPPPFRTSTLIGKDGAVAGSLPDAARPVLARLDADKAYAADLIWLDAEPQLAVAAVRPGGGAVVATAPVNGPFMDEFAQRYGVNTPRLVHSVPSIQRLDDYMRRGNVTVRGPDGRGQAVLTWSTASLNRLFDLPIVIMWGLTVIIVTLGVLAYRYTRRLAQSLVSSEEHAQHLALHDPMTGLANRSLFANRLEFALEQRRRAGGMVGVLAIDLDRFKHVNDTLGHAAGDELIREASRRLLSICRTTDTVARLGGDELALVALLPTPAAVEILARRAVERLSGMIDLPGGQARLSASIGVTVVDDQVTDAAEALRQADLALYRAKDQGRGRYSMFEQAMDESLRLRRQTEADLRAALENGEIEVHYQPQFTARGGKLESVEALARWRHAQRGMISPAYFVPVAEESGLIHALGDQVLRQVCADATRWPGLKVAVNVSPVQLRRPDFADRCRAILDEYHIEAERIELEITEGVLLDNDQRTQVTLRTLRDLRFKIALDDFGTGYSSLSYLNAYPVDKIKIDRSFVSALGVQEDADKVVRAIVKLGKALGLQVTAEGVETEGQRAELVAAGCTILQGYLQAKPGDAGAVDTLLAQIKAGQHAA